eukprot:TRINITY_DN4454_c0_g1_i2.p3 TRINITY_DN4454_c0_g1~~TRINITY_DN4454_c0_g1_i2.p3  ORF type:complete len:102 (+),score=0.15 TRINITY_DN4454_c0_g1_i2:463-768(+)
MHDVAWLGESIVDRIGQTFHRWHAGLGMTCMWSTEGSSSSIHHAHHVTWKGRWVLVAVLEAGQHEFVENNHNRNRALGRYLGTRGLASPSSIEPQMLIALS